MINLRTTKMKLVFICLTLIVFAFKSLLNGKDKTREFNKINENKAWSISEADDWYAQHKWLVGCNFIPSTAINL